MVLLVCDLLHTQPTLTAALGPSCADPQQKCSDRSRTGHGAGTVHPPLMTRSRHGDHLSPSPRSTPSEVRLLGARNVGVAVVVIILMAVFSTDDFRQNIRSRHIGQGRGPRRREDALVLDRQVQLKELAPMVTEDIAVE